MEDMIIKFGASFEDIVRFSINPDLTCDTSDPQNARYLTPFSDAKREERAYEMASLSYSAATDEFDDDTTQAEADKVFEQCIVDARRMLCDPDYMGLFGGDAADCNLAH